VFAGVFWIIGYVAIYFDLNRPNIEILIKMAEIFKVSTDYILGVEK